MEKLLINTQEQLTAFCQMIKNSPWLAVDTEFVREKSYYPKLCLLQVANDQVAGCIDTLCIDELSTIMDILYAPNTVKVFHACHQDLEIFAHLNQTIPKPIFDTQIAGALIGLGAQEGYASVVKKLLGTTLDKSQTRTNWEQRPLDDKQLEYAYADVIYLGKVYQVLIDKLTQLERLDWLHEDFTALENPHHFLNAPLDMWSKVKGRQALKGVQMAVLQALAAWRENRAQQTNIPRRWVISDDTLLDIAKQMPSVMKNLTKIRGVNKKTVENNGQEILSLIQSAQETPREQWPKNVFSQRKPTPSQEAFADILMAIVRIKAEEHNVNPITLAKRKDLEKLVTGEQPEELLSGWKKSLIGETLLNIINGDATIHIQNGQIHLQEQ